MASAAYTLASGTDLVARHLDGWSFGLDHARTRVGACHYAARRITCSTYLVAYLADDEVDQVILHEIAHGLVGQKAGHTKVWLRQARRLGYLGARTIEVPEARLSARWLGVCRAGHQYYRHRRPTRVAYCSLCAHRARIDWQDRGLGLLARG